MYGYSVLRASQNAPVVLDLIDQLAAFNIPLEGFHTETGPGVYEAAIGVDEGIARGRQGRALQDGGKGDRRAPRHHADVYGEMECRSARL